MSEIVTDVPPKNEKNKEISYQWRNREKIMAGKSTYEHLP